MTTTTPTRPLEHSAAEPARGGALRGVEGIHGPPGLHWVGDGFRVHGYFSAIPNAARRLSPFLLLDYHPVYAYSPTDRPRGVGVHPHRGFETVTMAWEGSVAHHDSTGAGGVIHPGDAQWMTAASGILHKEYHEASFSRRGGPFHMAQLWVNLPKSHKMSAPRYQAIEAAEMGLVTLPDGKGSVRILAGEHEGVRGPAKTFTPVTVLDVRLNAKGAVDLRFAPRDNVGLLVMKGAIDLGGKEAKMDDFVVFDHAGDRVHIEAKADAHLLVLGGEPIEEPVVQYGPFVMNTVGEIQQAIRDFADGRFGTLED